MVVAKSAGSFLGGIFNNPGVVILAGLAILLLFFQKDIREAFGSFGESFGKIELPDITLPEITFPEIKFPDFPDFKFPDITNIFGGGQDVGTDVDKLLAAGGTPQDVEALLTEEERLLDPNRDPTKFLPPDLPTRQPIGEIFPDQPVSISDFINRFTKPTEQDFGVTVSPALLDETQGFIGGGISFEGGTIFETPIENLSLSQIINKFMVTASQAANIKAQAIGFTPEEQAFLNQGQEISPLGDIASQPAVSGPQFAGLTPEQIALRLTGGNISNF